MYSDIGVLPTWLDLQRPSMGGTFSIFHAFSTPGELRFLFVLMVANAVCLMVGYKTRVAQLLAIILQIGMNTRISMIENGGYVVNNLLGMWTAFLPMGDRFSVDALLASLKRRRERGAADLNDRATLVPADKATLHVSVLVAWRSRSRSRPSNTSTSSTRRARRGTTARRCTTSSTTTAWRRRWSRSSATTSRTPSSSS